MRKAVVTGASGFIGAALVGALARDGVSVIACSRRKTKAGGCESVELDVREPDALDSLLDDKTTLFHMAGHTSVAGSVKEPLFDFEANVSATLNVLESVRNTGARLIFPSSPAVFAPGQSLPLTETAVKRPSSPYGAAKLACEGYVQAYHACYGVDARIARIFNVYGPGMTRFAIYDFWRKISRNRERIEILGDGEQIRDYLYLDDAAQAMITIAEIGEPGEDYNVASGIPVRTADLARQVAACMGTRDINLTTLGRSFPGDIGKWYADVRKLTSLGFEATISLQDGLATTISAFESAHTTGDHLNEARA